VSGFFSHRLFAGTACVANHFDLKADSAHWRPVIRNPYDSGVLPQFAAFRNVKPEARRLRLTSPEERVCSVMEDKTFDFYVEGKGCADWGIQNQGPMAAFLGFWIKLHCSRLGLLPGSWCVEENL